MPNERSHSSLAGPSWSSSAARLGLAAWLVGLAACGQLDSDEAKAVAKDAKAVAKEAGQEVVAASKGVAAATKDVAQATKEVAQEQLDKVDPKKVEKAVDGVASSLGVQTNSDPANPDADPLAGASEAIECDEEGKRCTVTSDFADRARQNGHRVAEQLRLTPASGDVKGLRVDAIDAGSLAALIGLKVGDVITHVNGTPIGSMQDAIALYMSVRSARSFTIDYQRGGEARTLQLDVV